MVVSGFVLSQAWPLLPRVGSGTQGRLSAALSPRGVKPFPSGVRRVGQALSISCNRRRASSPYRTWRDGASFVVIFLINALDNPAGCNSVKVGHRAFRATWDDDGERFWPPSGGLFSCPTTSASRDRLGVFHAQQAAPAVAHFADSAAIARRSRGAIMSRRY